MPASFVNALRGEYQQFSRVRDVGKFSFSSIFGDPCFPNMPWSDQVAVLYCPFQVDGRHWIGVVIDISQWRIHVLDCNRACLHEDKLETLLNPIVRLMPLLIRRNGGKDLNEAAMESTMPITRLDLPFCCEPTGVTVPLYVPNLYRICVPRHNIFFSLASFRVYIYARLSCVATHILLELHATDNMQQVANLSEETIAIAAQTYAVEAFAAFNPEHLNDFPIA